MHHAVQAHGRRGNCGFEVFSQRLPEAAAQRYLVTTNLPFDEWTVACFGHRSVLSPVALPDYGFAPTSVHILEMNGISATRSQGGTAGYE